MQRDTRRDGVYGEFQSLSVPTDGSRSCERPARPSPNTTPSRLAPGRSPSPLPRHFIPRSSPQPSRGRMPWQSFGCDRWAPSSATSAAKNGGLLHVRGHSGMTGASPACGWQGMQAARMKRPHVSKEADAVGRSSRGQPGLPVPRRRIGLGVGERPGQGAVHRAADAKNRPKNRVCHPRAL